MKQPRNNNRSHWKYYEEKDFMKVSCKVCGLILPEEMMNDEKVCPRCSDESEKVLTHSEMVQLNKKLEGK